jgi:hypothetical protein
VGGIGIARGLVWAVSEIVSVVLDGVVTGGTAGHARTAKVLWNGGIFDLVFTLYLCVALVSELW